MLTIKTMAQSVIDHFDGHDLPPLLVIMAAMPFKDTSNHSQIYRWRENSSAAARLISTFFMAKNTH